MLLPFAAIFTQASFVGVLGQEITVTNVTPNQVCFSASATPVSVDFTTDVPFNDGNTFTAELSDATGSFATPIVLGTLEGIEDGTINGAIPDNTPAGTGYLIRIVASDPAVTSNNSLAFTINAPPTTADAGDDQINDLCGLTTTTLEGNTPTVGTGAWTLDAVQNVGEGGSFVDSTSPTSGFNGTAGTEYVLRWTITNGVCPASFDRVRIRFNVQPTPPDAGLAQNVCGSTTTTLTANTPVFGTGQWTFAQGVDSSGGSFGNRSDPHSTLMGNAGQTYTVRWTISTPCASPGDNVNIIFGSATDPAPSIELTQQDASSCQADGILTGTGSGGTGELTFDFVGGNQTAIENGLQVTGLAPGHYSMRVQDENGCSAVADATINRLPAPSIEVSTLGNASCNGQLGYVTIRVFPRTGTTATAIKPYSFRFAPVGDDITALPFEEKSVPVVIGGLEANTTYQVQMEDGAGCVSNILDDITIGQDAPLDIALSGWHHPSNCSATDGDITVKASAGSGKTYRYALSSDGGITFGPIQSGRRFSGLGVGTYVIRASDSRGCTADITKVLSSRDCPPAIIAGSTSSQNAIAKGSLNLQALPNPTRTAFTLNLQSVNKERVQIIVTDMFGKKVYQTTGSATQQYTFGREFASGMYIVQVIQGKEIKTLKLVKGN